MKQNKCDMNLLLYDHYFAGVKNWTFWNIDLLLHIQPCGVEANSKAITIYFWRGLSLSLSPHCRALSVGWSLCKQDYEVLHYLRTGWTGYKSLSSLSTMVESLSVRGTLTYQLWSLKGTVLCNYLFCLFFFLPVKPLLAISCWPLPLNSRPSSRPTIFSKDQVAWLKKKKKKKKKTRKTSL